MVLSTVLTDRLRMRRTAAVSADGPRWAGYPTWARASLAWLQALSPERRDALLYACSALFAGVTAVAVGIPLYRQWGQMAVGPYVAATVIMGVVAVRAQPRRPGPFPVPSAGPDAAPRPATGDPRWRVGPWCWPS